MGDIIARHLSCVSPTCNSSDALALYEEETEEGQVVYNATCYSCEGYFSHKVLAGSYLAEEYGISGKGGTVKSSGGRVKPKKYITDEQIQHIKSLTKIDDTKYRTLAKGVNSRYQVLSEYNEEGVLTKRYYPAYDLEGKLCGYKVRVVSTKDFYSIGYTGSDTQLYGLSQMKPNGRWIGIFGGEEDAHAAYEMLATHQHNRGYEPIPCVSPSTSETASIKNIQLNYEKLDSYDKIIIGFDDDKKGQEYAVKAAEVCPPGKVYLMRMPVPKDPCDVKKANKSSEFVKEFFFNSVKYKPQGVVGSNELQDAVIEELLIEKVPLPPFMSKLEKMTAGGLPLGYIVNIGAASGAGKTTIINEMIYYWLFHSPHKVGVVSLELSKGQYGIAMLSRHIGKKLQLFEDPQEAVSFVTSAQNKAKAETLWKDEEGDSRWYLVDEREGSIENLKQQIKQLVISCGCKVVILDPLQDVLDSSTNEEQADFMKFQKGLIKKGITFVNINHVRKSGSGEKAGSQGRDLVEEDFAGSSTIFKSGGINVLCMRDKYAEDMITRNTTRVVLSKCRTTGMTGPAGEWYYDIDTHSLHDKDTFFASNTIESSVPTYEGDRDLLDCAVIGATNDDIMESFGDNL